jgi:uncharacterized protein
MPPVLPEIVSRQANALAAFCARAGIARLELFGSAAHGRLGDASDLDFLVVFAPERDPGFDDLEDMERELSALFGRQVDLVARSSVEASTNPIRRRHILNHAVPVYSRG